MSDLETLNPKELLALAAPKFERPEYPEAWHEIIRRLERLEPLESSETLLRKARELLVRSAQVLKRLEKCEALLQRYLLNHEGNTCSCSICDAARAALEG